MQFFSFSLTLAYMIGISGRNFASNLLVTAQIVCAGIPMTIALFSVGGAYYTVFAFVLVPFFATLKLISDRLRRVLLDAVVAGRDVSLLARRFDTALNNMPHGLCMFDAERRVAVCNKRLAALLGTAPDIAGTRPTAIEFVEGCVLAGTLSRAHAGQLLAEFESGFGGAGNGEVFLETEQGRTLALTFHPMADGGAVVLFEDITDKRVAEAKINQLARYDGLTGLPNRALFRDQMDAAVVGLRRRGPFAIHFIDLDEFKEVNDTLGHPCGDELLCVAADRLRAAVRGSDIVARFGGDEFVVLQYPLGHPKEAGALAERIVAEPRRALPDQRPRGGESAPASASRWRRATARMPISCSRTPTWRSTAPNPTGGVPGASSSTAWTCWRRPAATSSSICGARSRTRSSRCTTSLSSTCTPSASPPARRCCAGRIRCGA